MGGFQSLPEANLLTEFQRLNRDGFISKADTRVLINKFFQSGNLRPPPRDLIETVISELGDDPYTWQDIREHWDLMRRSHVDEEEQAAAKKSKETGDRNAQNVPNSTAGNSATAYLDPDNAPSSYTDSLGLATADGLPVGLRLAQGSMYRSFMEELERDMKQIRVRLTPPQPGAPSSVLHQAVNYRGSHTPVSGHARPQETPPPVEGNGPPGVLTRAAWLHDQVEDEIHALQGQLTMSSQVTAPHHVLHPGGPGAADVQETLQSMSER